jgi:hypothetical protein
MKARIERMNITWYAYVRQTDTATWQRHQIDLRISECNPLDGVHVYVEENSSGKSISEIEVAWTYQKGHTTEEKFDFIQYFTWK